jgi:hypothetical protein
VENDGSGRNLTDKDKHLNISLERITKAFATLTLAVKNGSLRAFETESLASLRCGSHGYVYNPLDVSQYRKQDSEGEISWWLYRRETDVLNTRPIEEDAGARM